MKQDQAVCISRTLIFMEMQNQLYYNTYTVLNEFYFVFLRFYWNQWIFYCSLIIAEKCSYWVF